MECIKEILDDLVCPLSNKLFFNPVIAPDNEVYEASELEKWILQNGSISPKTKQPMTFDIIPIIPLKSFIDDLVEKKPELNDNRYKVVTHIKSYNLNKHQVVNFIKNGNYDELLNFTNYSLTDLCAHLESVIKSASVEVIKHIFNNSLDKNLPLSFNGYMMHKCNFFTCIVKWGTPEMLEQIIDDQSELDINESGDDGTLGSPLHYALYRKNFGNFKVLLENGADIFYYGKDSLTPLKYACQIANAAIINYVIDFIADNYDIEQGDNYDDEISALQMNDNLDFLQLIEFAEKLGSLNYK